MVIINKKTGKKYNLSLEAVVGWITAEDDTKLYAFTALLFLIISSMFVFD